MDLIKNSQSMQNMFIDESPGDIEDHNWAPAMAENRNEEILFEDDEDKDGHIEHLHEGYKQLQAAAKIRQNETDDEKAMLNKEWDMLQNDKHKQYSDLIIIKDEDMRFKSTSDIFSYTDIGEPQKEQHLSIDFSPEKGVDDDRNLIEKCVSFWKFIGQFPELESLRAEPTKNKEEAFVLRTPSSSSETYKIEAKASSSTHTFVASPWIMKQDMMSYCLATKTSVHACQPVSYEYTEYQVEPSVKAGPADKKGASIHASKMTLNTVRGTCDKRKQPHADVPMNDLTKLLADMHQFDTQHNKVITSLTTPTYIPMFGEPRLRNGVLPEGPHNSECSCKNPADHPPSLIHELLRSKNTQAGRG
ncbi:unnamed protein product [Chrysodeixis includens]|uniref:Uncharacterized protein n=1 Tax=Chrysodeixis includens TaxID=689277 RepID=A0A9P0FP62_CHRIL|nr:unnamed protein product [Chrysodeixis includens]